MQPWRTRRTVKLLGSENGARPEAKLDDFALRKEHTALLTALNCASDGAFITIEVKHGLPFLVEIEKQHDE